MSKKHPHAGKTGYVRMFLEMLGRLARDGRGHRRVFEAWVEATFSAFATRAIPERADEFEARYRRAVGASADNKVGDQEAMGAMLGCAILGLHEEHVDFLGQVATECNALDAGLGQFFTPYEVSRMMAAMLLHDCGQLVQQNGGYITVCDPASGSGGMVLAVADHLQENGYDPGGCLFVHATDLSELAFKMTYIQLCARGIAAQVVHGDSLSGEKFESLPTLKARSFRLWHCARDAPKAEGLPDPNIVVDRKQLELRL